nr:protein translocase subunit SecD [Gammaproteobacteria bacterium]
MNRYPLWKYLLLLTVLVGGLFFALPNLYGEDPAIQVSASRGVEVNQALEERVTRLLQDANIEPKRVERTADRLLARFSDTETQLKARDLVRDALGVDYVVALNLAPATPVWLTRLGALPMYLGLDLRGGVHFLMAVDMQAAVQQAAERYVGDIRTFLRSEKVRYRTIARNRDKVEVSFRDAALRDQAAERIAREFPELKVTEQDDGDAPRLQIGLNEDAAQETQRFALQQNLTTLRNRVNELGVAEPVIQQQGSNRIVVELPGVQDTARAKEILGATATLEFRMVHSGDVAGAVAGRVPVGARLYQDREERPLLLDRTVMLTGDYITDAASGIDSQTGSPAVFITLDGKGARIFAERTKDQVGKAMAVVFIEHKTDTALVNGKSVKRKRVVEEVINVATIRERLGKRFQITGLDSTEEARNLALLLRAGALVTPIEIIEERTIGPSLGKENIEKGYQAVVGGFIAIGAFMIVYYALF